ncbi:hypothetical protein SK128_025582 [Halocaridina rubra]|uniref:Protein kinase domain-containing protein n=1 Tax=Halocaridina rubra TaxID=373956 RepID=A0AAN8XFT3_HALRR
MSGQQHRKTRPLATLASPLSLPSFPGEEIHPANGHILGCGNLHAVTNLTVIGAGWTKIVYRGHYKNMQLAIKTVHTAGHDMFNCHTDVSVCYQHAAAKIMKESELLQQLAHSNVIKVLGECIPNIDYFPGPPAVGMVSIVTELGQQLDVVQILQMNFEDRLRLAYDVGKILQHLALSPLGSLLMKDFRRQQFVLVDGIIKLSDVDDLVIGDPRCSFDNDCLMKDENTDNVIVNLTCEEGRCSGFNSRLNAVYAGRHFMRYMMPYGCPEGLETEALDMVNRQLKGILNSEGVFLRIHQLVKDYSSGSYLTPFDKEYINNYAAHHGFTIQDADFSCFQTVSIGCVQSVSSAAEGALLCSRMHECRAFVLLDDFTWTGRQIAVFKSAATGIKENTHHKVYIRRGQG